MGKRSGKGQAASGKNRQKRLSLMDMPARISIVGVSLLAIAVYQSLNCFQRRRYREQAHFHI
ncbi:hypothetical protein [Pseudomonas sp. Sample_20]|uniref:hypothetical protein n=1 Tax=Pseudomonas sp. Sample_20 TaxID=2448264 RepID=UPI001032BC0A|nr:hypothetical protein [Pseudomonas sp. Sample_20]